MDSDPILRQRAGMALEEAGFHVSGAACGREALRTIEQEGLPHLAIGEMLLEDLNGLQFWRKLCRSSDLPVIILTTVAREETVVMALEEFAHDYLLKPCQPKVLVAHVRRVLQRIGGLPYTRGREVPVDDRLSVDFAGCAARVDGNRVVLTHTESKLLYILMRSAGRTVATGFLLDRLALSGDMHEETLRVHVHNLRMKIEPDPSRPHHVLTEWGLGYRFEPASGKSEASPAASSPARRRFASLGKFQL